MTKSVNLSRFAGDGTTPLYTQSSTVFCGASNCSASSLTLSPWPRSHIFKSIIHIGILLQIRRPVAWPNPFWAQSSASFILSMRWTPVPIHSPTPRGASRQRGPVLPALIGGDPRSLQRALPPATHHPSPPLTRWPVAAVADPPMVHADETGWRQDGLNGYVWTFSTPTERYFLRRGRNKEVVDEVLDESFTGCWSATPPG